MNKVNKYKRINTVSLQATMTVSHCMTDSMTDRRMTDSMTEYDCRATV